MSYSLSLFTEIKCLVEQQVWLSSVRFVPEVMVVELIRYDDWSFPHMLQIVTQQNAVSQCLLYIYPLLLYLTLPRLCVCTRMCSPLSSPLVTWYHSPPLWLTSSVTISGWTMMMDETVNVMSHTASWTQGQREYLCVFVSVFCVRLQ